MITISATTKAPETQVVIGNSVGELFLAFLLLEIDLLFLKLFSDFEFNACSRAPLIELSVFWPIAEVETAIKTPPVIQNQTATPKLSIVTMFNATVPSQIPKIPAIRNLVEPVACNIALNPI